MPDRINKKLVKLTSENQSLRHELTSLRSRVTAAITTYQNQIEQLRIQMAVVLHVQEDHGLVLTEEDYANIPMPFDIYQTEFADGSGFRLEVAARVNDESTPGETTH